jgi:hypothetical protein
LPHQAGACLYLDGNLDAAAGFAAWYRTLMPDNIKLTFCDEENTFATPVPAGATAEELVSAAPLRHRWSRWRGMPYGLDGRPRPSLTGSAVCAIGVSMTLGRPLSGVCVLMYRRCIRASSRCMKSFKGHRRMSNQGRGW